MVNGNSKLFKIEINKKYNTGVKRWKEPKKKQDNTHYGEIICFHGLEEIIALKCPY